MAELREFQKAAVDRIVHMLDSNNSGRYLLADEALRTRVPFGGFPWGRLAYSQPGKAVAFSGGQTVRIRPQPDWTGASP